MTEDELLKTMTKRTTRNANTKKYGMFGLALGEDNYNRLEAYCKKHNIYKYRHIIIAKKRLIMNMN